MELTVGQRIDIFEVNKNPYGGDTFIIGSHYAELAGNKYSGNEYGRDMIGNKPKPSFADAWHLNADDMRKVGTVVIKKVKNPIWDYEKVNFGA